MGHRWGLQRVESGRVYPYILFDTNRNGMNFRQNPASLEPYDCSAAHTRRNELVAMRLQLTERDRVGDLAGVARVQVAALGHARRF